MKKGQLCIIKVETFDFQKYGTIEGAVEAINPYSLEENGKEKNADKEKEIETGGYPVRFKLFADALKIKDGTVYPIKPGMSVTSEINVGKRRVIEFFLFPIIRYLDDGLKVR